MDAGDGERCGFGWSFSLIITGTSVSTLKGSTNDSSAVLQMIRSEKIAVAVIANTGITVPFEIAAPAELAPLEQPVAAVAP